MNIGISTSCLYPHETENSFRFLAEGGVKTAEIFFNARCELCGDILDDILKTKKEYGVDVVSVHGFPSFAEGYFLFSPYKRRHFDFLEDCRAFFEAEAKLGARFHILHGLKTNTPVTSECYADQLHDLIAVGREYGIAVAQENVVHYHSGSISFMKELASHLGSEFTMVFDIKQSRRAGEDAFAFFRELSPYIKHLHLSDFTAECDCALPREGGRFDFTSFFKEVNSYGFRGDAMLEVYGSAYNDPVELFAGREYLENALKEAAS